MKCIWIVFNGNFPDLLERGEYVAGESLNGVGISLADPPCNARNEYSMDNTSLYIFRAKHMSDFWKLAHRVPAAGASELVFCSGCSFPVDIRSLSPCRKKCRILSRYRSFSYQDNGDIWSGVRSKSLYASTWHSSKLPTHRNAFPHISG